MTPQEIAKSIADELRQHPERWTQREYARLADRGGCAPDDPKAVQWCLLGMVRKRFHDRFAFYECVGSFRMQMTDGITDFNDKHGRTIEEVIELC